MMAIKRMEAYVTKLKYRPHRTFKNHQNMEPLRIRLDVVSVMKRAKYIVHFIANDSLIASTRTTASTRVMTID